MYNLIVMKVSTKTASVPGQVYEIGSTEREMNRLDWLETVAEMSMDVAFSFSWELRN